MSRPTPALAVFSPLPPARSGGGAWGTGLVAGLVLLGVAAAVTGVWFQRHQTRRCLAFYGPDAARRITSAPTVELLLVQPGSGSGRLAARERIDVSAAPGLVHLRRGLVEDANFGWLAAGAVAGAAAPLPAEVWDVALVFRAPGGDSTTLVIDFDSAGGWLTAVGKPGRIGLGRIGPGLEKWIQSTLAAR